ncbi:MAG: hypothetical protein HQL72_05335 [Magnetococcales bacterium]|nr:hypothetical protein [Magnetococcales bacterium]
MPLFFLFVAFVGLSLSSPPLLAATSVEAEESLAVKSYRQFATAFIRGELVEASRFADGQALRTVRRKQYVQSKGEVTVPPVETEILIVGENPQKGGVQVDIQGVLLARHSLPDSSELETKVHRQTITMLHRKSGWKVVYFIDDLEKCCLP